MNWKIIVIIIGICTGLYIYFTNQTSSIHQKPTYRCGLNYAPVCGAGQTYTNSCFAEMNGITNYSPGVCP
ncbi:MAG: hypothetical protein VW397_05375 [Candidatus Margulisiibacteriota bacterium]